MLWCRILHMTAYEGGDCMAKSSMKALQAGAAPLIASMVRKMGLDLYLDDVILWDRNQCTLSPGTRIMGLIVNILMSREPLYHVADFYKAYDCELIFGRGVRAEHFNDDALARALDMLHQVNLGDLYGHLALLVHQSLYGHNNLSDLHLDRTTISLYGAYENPKEYPEELDITYGASKDHRPDLKQFSAGLVVNAEGLPLFADVGRGNLPENPWFRSIIPRLAAQHTPEERASLTVIADAAFVSEENLEKLFLDEENPQIAFISRLPGTYKEEKAVKERALAGHAQWNDIGTMTKRKDAAIYRCFPDHIHIGGISYRALVFSSSSLEHTKEKSLEKAWQRQRTAFLTECKAAMASLYACEEDARKAAEAVLAKHRKGVWFASYTVRNIAQGIVYFTPQRGRAKPTQTIPSPGGSTIQLSFDAPRMDMEKAAHEKELASLFVLLTNIPAQEADDREILRRYKEQHAVETGFKFLKGPCTLGPIFLKKEHRVEALSTVFLMAHLVGMAIQIRVRRGVRKRQRELNLGYRRVDNPTIRVIVQLFEQVLIVHQARGARSVHQLRYDYLDVLEDCALDMSLWTTVPG